MLLGGIAGGTFGYVVRGGTASPQRYAMAFTVNTGLVAFTCFGANSLLASTVPQLAERPRSCAMLAGMLGGYTWTRLAFFSNLAAIKIGASCAFAGLLCNECAVAVAGP
jgi:hypothetical protein